MHRNESGMKVLVGVVSSRVDIGKLFSVALDYYVSDCINVYPIVKPPAEKLWTYAYVKKTGILADRNIEKKSAWLLCGMLQALQIAY